MSVKTQIKHMKTLGNLLSQDLGYIFGERESGPNGAKKEFLHTGAAFMRALGKDLGLQEMKVSVNNAGIACSGEIYLHGMWGGTNGIYIMLEQMMSGHCILYRATHSMKSSGNFGNCFLGRDILERGDYDKLLETFIALRNDTTQEGTAYGRAS